MTLTSTAFKEEMVPPNPETRIIKTVRDVCIAREDDAVAGEVRRVKWDVGHVLIADGSAVEASEADLKAFEKAGGAAAIIEARKKAYEESRATEEALAIERAKNRAKS